MKLQRLDIKGLPGIDSPFVLDQLASGLNLLVGPNGIGKSRLCAAVRSMLWPSREINGGRLHASARFDYQGQQWQVVRDGSMHQWTCNGEPADPPRLPGDQLDGCFFLGLQDLLDESDKAGRELAGEIRRQMSGGYDLDALQQQFESSFSTRAGAKEIKALSAADSEIRAATAKQEQVVLQTQQLDELKLAAARAATAQSRLSAFDTALQLQQLQAKKDQLDTAIADYPEALAALDGKEIERLDRLENKRRDKHEAQLQLERDLAACDQAVTDNGLDEPLAEAVLGSWRERAKKLADIERRLDAANKDVSKATEQARNCQRVFGELADPQLSPDTAVDDATKEQLSLEDDAGLFAFLRESQQLASGMDAYGARLKVLEDLQFTEDQAQRLQALKQGLEPLRSWLRAPDPQSPLHTGSSIWPPRQGYLLAGIGLLALGVGVVLFALSALLGGVLVGVGAGLMSAAWLNRIRTADSAMADLRAVAQQQYPQTLEPPANWTVDGVNTCLRTLEEQIAALQAASEQARERAVERRPLAAELAKLQERNEPLQGQRKLLAARLGLQSLRPDLELVDTARALDDLRTARTALGSAHKLQEALATDCRERLSSLGEFVREHGQQIPRDSDAAQASVQSIDARNQKLRTSLADRERLRRQRQQIDTELHQLDNEVTELYSAAKVPAGNSAQLQHLLEQRGAYLELVHDRDEQSAAVKHAQASLARADESALADHDIERLHHDQAQLQETAERLEELNQQIGKITARAQIAREGHELEDAIVQRDRVLAELGERRDESLAAQAGAFLIERVRHEYETHQLPRVLERARERFALFTQQRYRLEVQPAEGGVFFAVDTRNGTKLRPDQLSDGTRAQLILAARLAFAEEVEQGARVPLFLDEALDHSDPERFHAIARSLARMVADEQRQVFYLSNDPTDVQRFSQAFTEEHCEQFKAIDFGAVLGRAAGIEGSQDLQVEPLASVPSPEGLDPEHYGMALGVSRFSPGKDAGSQHLFYVLRDDLDLLYTILRSGISTVGQCRNLLLSDSKLAKNILADAKTGDQIKARIELLEIFCRAWRQGRGRRVERVDIEASDAISDKFREAVVEIATELEGDAERLIETLREHRDPRLNSYRHSNTNDLQRYFLDKGYLDERPVLGEAGIVEQLLGIPAAARLPSGQVPELVNQWWAVAGVSTVEKAS